jgi:hypothetical protein
MEGTWPCSVMDSHVQFIFSCCVHLFSSFPFLFLFSLCKTTTADCAGWKLVLGEFVKHLGGGTLVEKS